MELGLEKRNHRDAQEAPVREFQRPKDLLRGSGDVTGMWDARADIALLDCRGDRLGRSLSQETAFAGSGALA